VVVRRIVVTGLETGKELGCLTCVVEARARTDKYVVVEVASCRRGTSTDRRVKEKKNGHRNDHSKSDIRRACLAFGALAGCSFLAGGTQASRAIT